MGNPGERPVITGWGSLASLGVKPVLMVEETAMAFIEGLRAGGGDGALVPYGNGLFRVEVTKLGASPDDPREQS